MSSAVDPLRHKNFRSLWAATVFSATGTFVQAVAGSWLMFELTESGTWVGLMWASATLPLLFLSLISGALADMFDRAKLMLVAQGIMGGSAVAMSLLTYLDLMTPGLLLGLGLVLGSGVALNIPAWQALLPELVPRGLVASAVALQSAAFNTARAVGPALGGAIYVAYGPEAGFGINAITYLAVIVVLIMIRPELEIREREETSVGSAISLGLRYARFTPSFRRLLSLVALFSFTSAVVQAILPVHTDHLGGSAGAFGVLLGGMGAGALCGAFFRSHLFARVTRSTVPFTMVLFGLAGIALGIAPNLEVAFVAMLVVGFCWLLTMATLNATAQLMSPEWIRGRAMALYILAFAGILPLGSILSGVLADWIGTPGALVVFSSASVLIGLVSPRFGVPRLEDVESPEFSDQILPPHDLDESHEGGPVMVLNTWRIDPADLGEFTALMNQVRMVRLRTGAYRWRLFRNVADPTLITEMFAVAGWEEHLAQHGRIDTTSAAILARARDLDREGGPRNRHLIAIDMERPPDFDELVARHEMMHRMDGSIPVSDQES